MKLIKVISILSLLLGISIHAMDSRGMHEQALRLSPKKLKQKLRDNPMLLNQQDSDGKTLLMVAIAQGNASAVKNLLVHFNPDPWLTDANGEGAFHYVSKTANLEIARMLLNKYGNDQTNWIKLNSPGSKFAPSYYSEKINNHGVAVLFSNYNQIQDSLFGAILFGDIKKIDEILKKNPEKINEMVQTHHCVPCTPLIWAIHLEDDQLVKYLLDKGAKVELPDASGMTAYDWASNSPKIKAILPEPIMTLATKTVSQNTKTIQNASEVKPVKVVTVTKSVSDFDPHQLLSLSPGQFEKTLISNPNAIDSRDQDGKTLLHLAVEQEQLKKVKTLLAKNANPWISDAKGECSFNAVFKTKNLTIARELLKKHLNDAEFRKFTSKFIPPNENGFGILFHNIQHSSVDDLFKAILLGEMKKIQQILQNDSSRINKLIPTTHCAKANPLIWAVHLEDEEMVRLLCNRGADVAFKDSVGFNAFDWAGQNQKLRSVLKLYGGEKFELQEKLLSAIAKSDFGLVDRCIASEPELINLPRHGITPLRCAVQSKNAPMAEALIKKGASLKIDQTTGTEPLFLLACLLDDVEMMRLLANYYPEIDLNLDHSKKYWPYNYGGLTDGVKNEILALFDKYIFKKKKIQEQLSKATRLNRTELIAHVLAKGADINGLDDKGNTALHWACTIGDPETIAYLLNHKANPNFVDHEKQRSSLQWLLRMHKSSVEKNGRQITTTELLPCFFMLSCSGANTRIKDNVGKTLVDWITNNQKFTEQEKDLVEDALLAKYKTKKEREELLDKIYNFQFQEIKNAKKNPNSYSGNDIVKMKEALIKIECKAFRGLIKPDLKDIYQQYIS